MFKDRLKKAKDLTAELAEIIKYLKGGH